MRSNVLISTLGASPDIIEETVGLFNFDEQVDFYKGNNQVAAMRQQLEHVDEVWLVSTDRQHVVSRDERTNFMSTEESFEYIKHNCEKFKVGFRLFVLYGVADITSEKEARCFHDLLLRVVAFAHQQKDGGRVYLSLACGRKTMSTDMQDAAYVFGCDMLLHVLGDNKNSAMPLLVGKVYPNEAVKPQQVHFGSEAYCLFEPRMDYLQDLENQKLQSQHFYMSYYLDEKETRSNFHILYTLPPSKIKQLKEEKLGCDKGKEKRELDWLRMLPKTDLHCHLGGVLFPEEIVSVSNGINSFCEENAMNNPSYSNWLHNELHHWEDKGKIDCKALVNNLAKNLKVPKCCVLSPFLQTFDKNPKALKSIIYGDYANESRFVRVGIERYERMGDMQGSSLLDSIASIKLTLDIFLRRCIFENVKYIEIRCSPINYAKTSGLPASSFVMAICEMMEMFKDQIKTSLLFIVSRHRDDMTKEYVNLVQQMKNDECFRNVFRGFDVAGNESVKTPLEMRESFMDIMRDCYNITIHAGEDQPVDNIWEAVYHLNAERIGHGLTLKNNEDLLVKFLERGIGIEMCPSSNFQIVGFRDNYYPIETAHLPEYPLKMYLEKELKVSVNTDDPGISLTDMTHELHKAARMTMGGLSKWEILQLVCNGFRAAFFPYDKKKELIRTAEDCLGKLINKGKL